MEGLVLYSLKTAGLTAVLYLLWRVLLKKETLHRLNRAILVFTPVLSMILPLCVITVHKTVASPAPDAGASAGVLEEVAHSSINTGIIIGIIYLIGVALVLLRMACSACKLWSVIKKGEAHTLDDGSTLIVTENDLPPFSWMGHIVLSKKDHEAGNPEVILHERAHIRLRHSLDILLTDFLSAFQWYNPLIWALGNDLRGVHEYEADENVLKGGNDPSEYQLFLINRAALANGLSLVSGFQSGTIKGRIRMMLKGQTSWKSGLKALYIIPVVILTLIACSKTVTEYATEENSGTPETRAKADGKQQKATDSELVPFQMVDDADQVPFQLVEKKPTFNGGNAKEFSKWVNANLIYPEKAKDLSIQGRITLQFTVSKTGKVQDVKVLRGIHPLLDNEALRVVSASPDWTPGNQKGRMVDVTYTFPVIFQLR